MASASPTDVFSASQEVCPEWRGSKLPWGWPGKEDLMSAPGSSGRVGDPHDPAAAFFRSRKEETLVLPTGE